MVERYLHQKNLAEHDVRFCFNPGDYVLLKQKVPGKLKVRATGPFIFKTYTGSLQVMVQINDQ